LQTYGVADLVRDGVALAYEEEEEEGTLD